MSEGRFPSYHHLPPAAPAPQKHHLSTTASPSLPHPLTFQPPPISHQLSSWLAKQDMAAYRNTPYTSIHNVGSLQMHKPQHTPIIDRWMDARTNMPPPSRTGPPSPSPAHAANLTSSFSLPQSVQLDLTKHKKEPQQVSIDLSSHKPENISLPKTKEQINGLVTLSKLDDKPSVIAHNPLAKIKSERCDNDTPLVLKSDNSILQNKVKINDGKKDNKQKVVKCFKTIEKSPNKLEITDTNHVEKMLENIFQTNETEKTSAIKIATSSKSPSPSTMRAESVEKILKSPSPGPKSDHMKQEDLSEKSSKIHDKQSQFLEVENKLEELFGGVDECTNINYSLLTKEEKSKPLTTNSNKRSYSKNKKPIKKLKKVQQVQEKTKANDMLKKNKGPLIRINGNIDNPTSFVVVNRSIPEDEDSLDGRNINIRKNYLYKSSITNGEEKPDVDKLESNGWQCVFCSRGPHVRDIGYDPVGDLFGPYYVSLPKHAIKKNDNAKRKACVFCGINGASIGCTARHCKSSIHYSCALQLGWLLDNQSFLTTCNLHRDLPEGTCHH
ncbi:uncharacterized protein LOC126895884 isoform X2 [Daktulosphaira vitifoliae]|uniref:uncharacterized protein LOC126895884 isoform X2 n=1 Tax=Daktulosphaira vitifoliae TaxID=58002 RepID=UPI0021AAEA92|nr:uncharacterized protein LOC126895884 isoform X2 [Daktulosphaira vitifoliae]